MPASVSLTVVTLAGKPPESPLTAEIGADGGTIGRGADNDLVLPDPEKIVSLHHATLIYRADDTEGTASGGGAGFRIEDTSTNGVYLNGSDIPIGQGRTVPLKNGDRIRIGHIEILATVDLTDLPPPPVLDESFGADAPGSSQTVIPCDYDLLADVDGTPFPSEFPPLLATLSGAAPFAALDAASPAASDRNRLAPIGSPSETNPVSVDCGATIIRPSPGGPRKKQSVSPVVAPASCRATGYSQAGGSACSSSYPGDNPLLDAASPIFSLVGYIRGRAFVAEPLALREEAVDLVRRFETAAGSRGLRDEVVLPARYCLCAMIDESVMDTPWGAQSVWAKRGLLKTFHNETWGGEKLFVALERLLAFPSGNLHLLELMYVLLALGFEGKFRVLDGGADRLARVRENLYLVIRGERGEVEARLSPHGQPTRSPATEARGASAATVAASIGIALCVGSCFAIYAAAWNASGEIAEQLAQWTPIDRPAAITGSALEPGAPYAAAGEGAAELLNAVVGHLGVELEHGFVAPRIEGETLVLRIPSGRLFEGKSAEILPESLVALGRLLRSISSLDGDIAGDIVVVGYAGSDGERGAVRVQVAAIADRLIDTGSITHSVVEKVRSSRGFDGSAAGAYAMRPERFELILAPRASEVGR